MKRLSLLLLCSALTASVYADNSIAQYESGADLSPTLSAGKALSAPVVEFSQFTLDSSGDDNVNTTTYSDSDNSGGGDNSLNVTVINKTGKPMYVYVSQTQNIQSITPCTVVSSNTQYNISQQCHGDPLPSGGKSYLFLSTAPYSNNSAYSSQSANNFLCTPSGAVSPQGQAAPYTVQESQGYLTITATGTNPGDKTACQIIKT